MSSIDSTSETTNENLRLRNEALRVKFGFWKFLIGTVAVSVLTAVLNWQTQEKRLEFEIKENEFIAQFINVEILSHARGAN